MTAAPSQTLGPGTAPQGSSSSRTPQNSAEYSEGATTDTGARRKASVRQSWPIAPVMPSAASQPASAQRSGCQFGSASSPAPIASRNMNQKDMAAVESVLPRSEEH